MCGIVGIIGRGNISERLIHGLKNFKNKLIKSNKSSK